MKKIVIVFLLVLTLVVSPFVKSDRSYATYDGGIITDWGIDTIYRDGQLLSRVCYLTADGVVPLLPEDIERYSDVSDTFDGAWFYDDSLWLPWQDWKYKPHMTPFVHNLLTRPQKDTEETTEVLSSECDALPDDTTEVVSGSGVTVWESGDATPPATHVHKHKRCKYCDHIIRKSKKKSHYKWCKYYPKKDKKRHIIDIKI